MALVAWPASHHDRVKCQLGSLTTDKTEAGEEVEDDAWMNESTSTDEKLDKEVMVEGTKTLITVEKTDKKKQGAICISIFLPISLQCVLQS